ncbi:MULTISPECIES: PadR family transcriptional regulator [unclassified Cryobacterium]|uniref:PadR family transcriptional regulator n=1 Tax=unclassified Cryobacterium TaxID=2649013 RepID=UPI002AB34CAC|nr:MULTISPECIES: PadR family transcriptional regulator [unclassified Cryobacterium]MDY7528907.1 PadR family transcriptional regulator [Cryobacterium sp. 10C2]MDY7558927.1 PadR family transcriptional regulator [Cryobacterium sp. 10C3]MEB0200716.1 PadR family transcriptional regulator [Cryobacterium sp. 5I3]MEB0291374.1 PadR family transcriptional regulator [Cryobacterium sp. 10C2]
MALRHALLGLLFNAPASGYDLLKEFQGSLNEVWPATQSQVYTELTKLTREGLLTVASEGPRGRKEYVVTDSGHGELHQWLTEVKPEAPRRSDMLLRVFFLSALTSAERQSYLKAVGEVAASQLAELEEIRTSIERINAPLARDGLLALEYGIRLARLQTEWSEWAADRV